MKRQPTLFLSLFTITGTAVFALARGQQPEFAAAAGIAGLLVHWRLSSGNDSDAELADSSYFLGFLLTLVLLAAGLWSLASVGAASATRPSGAVLYQFLYDLGAGLTITIAGLAIRQIRTLSAARDHTSVPAADAPSTLEPLLRQLIATVERLPEGIAARETVDPQVRAQRATDSLHTGIAEAAPRIMGSLLQLEDSITRTTGILTRSASTLGDSLTQTAERVETQIGDLQELLAKERAAMLAQLEEWRLSLGKAHDLLIDGHQSLDSEYRRGLLAVSAAGRSFTQLSNQVAADVKRLPNPSERLEKLWSVVQTMDDQLRASIGDASTRLVALGAQAQAAGESVERLSESLRTASTSIEKGGNQASATLQRELRDLSKVLDEFVGLLNERVETIGVR